jgi:bla regulator protein BlaR1
MPGLADSQATTFHEALAGQLGLQLKPARAALDILVVDHFERPVEN